MNLTSILIVLWYTVQPLLWLILLALILILGAQVMARLQGYRMRNHSLKAAGIVSALIGVATLLIAPIITGSSLSNVATAFDWFALIMATIGVGLYSLLVVHPLLFLMRNAG